jgi:hypothetical protein
MSIVMLLLAERAECLVAKGITIRFVQASVSLRTRSKAQKNGFSILWGSSLSYQSDAAILQTIAKAEIFLLSATAMV